MTWDLQISPRAQKQIDQLDKPMRLRVIAFLHERLIRQPNPWILGEPLTGIFAGQIRYRVGDYRMICEIFEDKMVLAVLQVGHRSTIYHKRKY